MYALHVDHARICGKFRNKLPVPDIKRINFFCAPGKKHFGKSAGRSPDIKDDLSFGVDRPPIKRVFELERPARNPFDIFTEEGDHVLLSDKETLVLHYYPIDGDVTFSDQHFSTRARRNKPPLGKRAVKPDLLCFLFCIHGPIRPEKLKKSMKFSIKK